MNYISIFNFRIPSYSVMMLLGLILGNTLAYVVIKRKKLIIEDLIIMETYGLAIGMLSAKLFYLWIVRDSIDWSKIFNVKYFLPFLQGGFVFYGGLFGGIFANILVKLIHKIDVMKYLSSLIFCIPLVHGFGRIGCYLSGCCYGIPYNGPFHVEYHNIPYSLCDVKLFPIQLVEALFLFILAIIFFYLVIKLKANTKLVYWYFICYSILRFILEFFRYDAERGSLWLLSTSQWISLIILIIIGIILIMNKKNAKLK